MRAVPYLAAILCSGSIASANELELLQDRCSEQERVIQQLEQENDRLKALIAKDDNAAEVTPAETEPASPVADESTFAIVQKGDSIAKLAARHGTTTDVLISLNKLRNPALIQPGDKLRLPAPSAEKPSTSDDASQADAQKEESQLAETSHVVKAGETFYSIARQHKISLAALQAANPTVKPTKLQLGQVLKLAEASPAPTPEPEAKQEPAAEEAPDTSSEKAENENLPEELTPSKSAPAEGEPEADSAPQAEEEPQAEGTTALNSVVVTEQIAFSAFAEQHNTTTDRLNALNSLNLDPSTVLAKGAELYVPAKP